MTCYVVPFYSISIEVIEYSNTKFVAISVIWLWFRIWFFTIMKTNKLHHKELIRSRMIFSQFKTTMIMDLNLPSSMRPKSLSSYVSFSVTRWPCYNASVVINSSSSPEITSGMLNSNINKMQCFWCGV